VSRTETQINPKEKALVLLVTKQVDKEITGKMKNLCTVLVGLFLTPVL